MNDRKEANIRRTNELWGLHDPEDGDGKGRCQVLVIDRRYLQSDEGFEQRLAVSFGDNVVTPETVQGFLPVPVRPGRLVFGIHEVAIEGEKLVLTDKWLDAVEAGDVADKDTAEARAQEILNRMTDDAYLVMVRVSRDDDRALRVSERFRLDEFDVEQP